MLCQYVRLALVVFQILIHVSDNLLTTRIYGIFGYYRGNYRKYHTSQILDLSNFMAIILYHIDYTKIINNKCKYTICLVITMTWYF